MDDIESVREYVRAMARVGAWVEGGGDLTAKADQYEAEALDYLAKAPLFGIDARTNLEDQ